MGRDLPLEDTELRILRQRPGVGLLCGCPVGATVSMGSRQDRNGCSKPYTSMSNDAVIALVTCGKIPCHTDMLIGGVHRL